MIPTVKLLFFLADSFVFLTAGALLRLLCLIFRRDPEPLLARTTMLWARSLLSILGITVTAENPEGHAIEPGSLIAANHQSYLDIIIIASIVPALFVAKKEVRSWPLLGWLAMLGGTVFIDREAFRGALNAMASMDRTLRNGVSVQIFPEGTSTNGNAVLPFRSFLFHSAVTSSRPVHPLTINYRSIDDAPVDSTNRDVVCWHGAMTFTDHLWKLLSHRSVHVSLFVHPPFNVFPGENAKSLSERAFSSVSSAFRPIS